MQKCNYDVIQKRVKTTDPGLKNLVLEEIHDGDSNPVLLACEPDVLPLHYTQASG